VEENRLLTRELTEWRSRAEFLQSEVTSLQQELQELRRKLAELQSAREPKP
jgi:prefoldin subunit 5